MRGNIVGSVAKPYLKETRNLSDKNCTKEMMQSVANFLSDSGYPEFISIKEMQKIDKQSFIKYFNVIVYTICLNQTRIIAKMGNILINEYVFSVSLPIYWSHVSISSPF